ncbi:MAG: hypothetical protein ACOY0T_19585 [Myxococcota bacterium]
MSDEKHTRRPAPLSKSYTLDGDTTEFNPWELQIHEFSPELRRRISELEKPKLDPQCLEDTLPPAGRGTPPAPVEPVPSPDLPGVASPSTAVDPVSGAPEPDRRRFNDRWRLGGLALLIVAGALYFGFRDASSNSSRPEHNVSGKVATVSVRAATANGHAPNALSPQPSALALSKHAINDSPHAAKVVAPVVSATSVIEVPSQPPPTAPRTAGRASTIPESSKSSAVAPSQTPRAQASSEPPTNLNVAGASSRRDAPSSNLFDTQLVPPID